MKYIRQTFERLSRGGFISTDSSKEEERRIYIDIDDHLNDYADYFSQIGFCLEQGNGYFYFTRKEQRVQLVDKLTRFGHWLDVLDFLKSWEPTFGPGFTFTKAALTVKIDADIELKDKASTLYEKKDRYEDIVEKLTDEMQRQGFIELIDEPSQLYGVVAAYTYLEELVRMITIETDDDDEVSQ